MIGIGIGESGHLAPREPFAPVYEKARIPLSVNTDDPKLFNNSLAEEYCVLHGELGFTKEEIHQLIEDGARSSWLPEERKTSLIERIRSLIGSKGASM